MSERASDAERYYKALQGAEDALVHMIRKALMRELELHASTDESAPQMRAQLLFQAKRDMKRLLRLDEVNSQ